MCLHLTRKAIFIALIHPIQWTIAYPVGPYYCALPRWRLVPPSCLDNMTSYLFRLACVLCRRVFNTSRVFKGKVCIMTDFQPYLQYFSVEVLSPFVARIYICARGRN